MVCKVKEVIAILEDLAPPAYAEEWDNVGLQVGSREAEVSGVLVSLDATLRVLEEARERGVGLLACHHPPIFRPLQRLITDEPTGSLVEDALVSGIAIYAAHTNLDASGAGVNAVLADIFGLRDPRPLEASPARGKFKLVTFLPSEHAARASEALFRAGSGVIGRYTGCSFRVGGKGTFTPGPGSYPFRGEAGRPNEVREVRLEVVVTEDGLEEAIEALLESHPYDEPACDVYPLRELPYGGMGRVGDLPGAVSLGDLARTCSRELDNPAVRLVGDPRRAVRRVAVCGGSGSGLMSKAMEAGAEVLITGDVGYHEAMEAAARGFALIDAGHYHTEKPVVSSLASLLAEKAGAAGLEVEVFSSDADTCPWNNGGEG